MSYETIRVGEDSHRSITVGTGESLTDTLIDIDRDGASAEIRTRGTQWRIENVGFLGTQDGHGRAAIYCGDVGGDRSVIRHVYLGDGGDGSAIEIRRSHSGRIDLSDIHASGWESAGYDSSHPTEGGEGTALYDTCYVTDCRAANFLTGDGELRRCVTDSNGAAGRGVWAWGDTDCVDCELGTGGNHYAIHAGFTGRSVTVTAEGGNYDDLYRSGLTESVDSAIELDGVGTSPDTSMPTSVPGSAEAAAEGETSVSVQSHDTEWVATDTQTISSAGEFTDAVAELHAGTDYEYRAHVESGEETLEGEISTFATNLNPGREETVVVEVEPGEHYTAQITGEETFENVIIDLTNNQTAATLTCEGADWTLRNIAFAGTQDLPDSSPCYSIVASVDAERSATIENIWLGDGSTITGGECGDNGRGGIYASDDHAGELDIVGATIAWFPGGGINAANASGAVSAQECYFENNGTNYVATSDGSEIRRSTVLHMLGGDT